MQQQQQAMVVFENPGEIDSRLITTLGVNVKDGESPIGFFGTGLKYAIAIALRNGCSVVIQSGLQEFTFTTRAETIRGKEFQFIEMQSNIRAPITGGPSAPTVLGFTTELGKTWAPWMAYRELYCNALDEGGTVVVTANRPQAQAGLTRVIVSGAPIIAAHHSRSEWLLQTRPIWANSEIEIHPRQRAGVSVGPDLGTGELSPLVYDPQAFYYRGIRVGTLHKVPAYTYNLLGKHSLTEDRTMHAGEMRRPLGQASADLVGKQLIKSLVVPAEGTYEEDMDWDWYMAPSKDFMAVVKEEYPRMRSRINKSALKLVAKYLPKGQELQKKHSVKLTVIEAEILRRARAFLQKLGHPVTFEIVVLDSLGSQWLMGEAHEGCIFLPKSLFGKGTKCVASTLLEEQVHLQLSLRDCSREMQDWLFSRLISLGEELQGEPL